MTPKMNFHTHTVFCDGKDTPEALIKAAVDLGFDALGFSGHAYTPDDVRYCMTPETTEAYMKEILGLKEKYAGDIKVLCGLEYDYFSEGSTADCDFLIGSVHYVKRGGKIYSVDGSRAHFEAALRAFEGDVYALIEEYYKQMGSIVEKTGAAMIGHFDLIAKFNEGDIYFSEKSPGYVRAWQRALERLLDCKACVFEINTGAMWRRRRSVPYPAPEILHEIAKAGGRTVLASDCHDRRFLDYGFEALKNTPMWSDVKKTLVTDYREVLVRRGQSKVT